MLPSVIEKLLLQTPAAAEATALGGERRELLPLAVSRVSNPDTVTSTGLAGPPALVPVPRPQDHADPSLRPGSDAASAVPPAGLPGHGSGAVLRIQSACIVDGQIQGGHKDVYELVCPGCGDDPDLDYSEVPARLQWLRGPRTLREGLAAYGRHLGIPDG